MLVEGERVGSKKNSPVIAKIKIGHSQFRHAGGGGGADGLGLSPGGGGLARLLIATPCDALAFRRVYRGPDDAGPDRVDSDATSGVLDGQRTGASRLTVSRTFRAWARSPVARAVQRDAEALHVRDVDAGEQRPDVRVKLTAISLLPSQRDSLSVRGWRSGRRRRAGSHR